jgi:hypothetical protein
VLGQGQGPAQKNDKANVDVKVRNVRSKTREGLLTTLCLLFDLPCVGSLLRRLYHSAGSMYSRYCYHMLVRVAALFLCDIKYACLVHRNHIHAFTIFSSTTTITHPHLSPSKWVLAVTLPLASIHVIWAYQGYEWQVKYKVLLLKCYPSDETS